MTRYKCSSLTTECMQIKLPNATMVQMSAVRNFKKLSLCEISEQAIYYTMKYTDYEYSLLKHKKVVLFRSSFDLPQKMLSNFFPCSVPFRCFTYQSTEQCYQHMKAVFAKNGDIANRILAESNSREIKSLGGMVPESQHWNIIKKDLMFAIMKKKYDNNPVVKAYVDQIPSNFRIIEFVRSDFWGIGDNGFGGDNATGKIWKSIRDGAYPEYVLLGDSIIKHVQLSNVLTCSMPGAHVDTIQPIAAILANLPTKGFIIHVGINDLVSRIGQYADSPNPNMLARQLILLSYKISKEYPDKTIIVCNVIPRYGTEKAQNKLSIVADKLRLQLSKKDTSNVRIFDVFSQFDDDLYNHDGVHLNPTGVTKYQGLLATALMAINNNTDCPTIS